MEDLHIITYEPPMVGVIEVESEGIVCASGEIPDLVHGWDLYF